MEQRFVPLSAKVARCILQECIRFKDLDRGRQMQSLIFQTGLTGITFLADHMIRLFFACESLSEANLAFNNVDNPSIYTWTAILSANSNLGEAKAGFDLYCSMLLSNVKGNNRYIYLAILKACVQTSALRHGKLVHAKGIIKDELESDVIMGNALIDMYGKCGDLVEAQELFHKLQNKNVVTWSAMIAAYARYGRDQIALQMLSMMQQNGLQPNRVTFLGILKSFVSMKYIEQSKFIHDQLINNGIILDVIVGNSLLDMYVKCGNLEEAWIVFDNLIDRDVVSWSSIIAGYAQNFGCLAIFLFYRMNHEGINPDKVTYLSIIRACSNGGALHHGRLLHEEILERGTMLDIHTGTALVDMYMKAGSIEEAEIYSNKLENRDVVLWGAIILGYAEHGKGLSSLQLYEKMQHEGIVSNKVIFFGILKACAHLRALPQGRVIHEQIMDNDCVSDVAIGNTLIDMYAKCGSLEEAQQVFHKINDRNVVTWNALIAGFTQHEDAYSALEYFGKMRQMGRNPNEMTLSNILKACGNGSELEHGRLIHEGIIEQSLSSDVFLHNCLVDMYAKCGMLEEAYNAFEKISSWDIVSWAIIISAYAQHEGGLSALELYGEMQISGTKANKEVLLSILKACGSIGGIEQGRFIHEQLSNDRMLDLVMGSALVSMYGDCGSLCEGHKVFDSFTTLDVALWNSMINAYAYNGHAGMAEQCFNVMQHEGVKPNEVTFASILVACCRAGFVEESRRHFCSMIVDHAIAPQNYHINCMVDLLSQEACWDEVVNLLLQSIHPNIIGWTSLLHACHVHGHVELARECFKTAASLDPHCAVIYILMGNIYASTENNIKTEVTRTFINKEIIEPIRLHQLSDQNRRN